MIDSMLYHQLGVIVFQLFIVVELLSPIPSLLYIEKVKNVHTSDTSNESKFSTAVNWQL